MTTRTLTLGGALALLLLLGGGCMGYQSAAALDSVGRGPDRCRASCEELGMRMTAFVLVDGSSSGCVCEPVPAPGDWDDSASTSTTRGASASAAAYAAVLAERQRQRATTTTTTTSNSVWKPKSSRPSSLGSKPSWRAF